MNIDLAKLKELIYNNLDIVFANLGIQVEEFDKNYYSNCPIHPGSDNPRGFSYNITRNQWKCWAHGCNEDYNSDIFGLIRGVLSKNEEEVSFNYVLSWVIKVLNINQNSVNTTEIHKSCGTDNISSIIKKMNKTIELPKDTIGKDWKVQIPSEYFIGRGFNESVLQEFQIGDCLDKKSFMKYRAVIPIYNSDGSLKVGSIGRRVISYIEPKFLFEKGFDKTNYLYNLHRAIKVAQKTSTLFLVEGQGDVWRLWECGVKNVVGLFGKDISSQQIYLINNLGITRLIVLLDHDQPGREAKIKIQRDLGRYFSLNFPNMNTKRDIGQMSPKNLNEKILFKFKGLY